MLLNLHRATLLFTPALIMGFFAFSPVAFAEKIPDFKASFEVEAMGMSLGKAKHQLRCQDSDCTLTNQAKPEGFAAMLSSDSSIERVKLKQTENGLFWLSYHKTGYSKKNGQERKKVSILEKSHTDNKVTFFRNQKKKSEWPIQNKLFDTVSLAYAFQHAYLNQNPLDQFVLQDTNFQDKLELKTQKNDSIDLGFADRINAVKYRLVSQNVQIELWLIPEYNYFPGRMRIVNQNDKTITLSLVKPPKIL